MPSSTPVRLAKWIGIVYALGVLLFSLYGADAPDVLVLSLLFTPWIVGPAGAAALCVKAARSSAGAWTFLVVEAGIILSTVTAWLYLIYVSPDAQNGIAMAISIPLFQYGAVAACFAVAYLLGWRARSSFLES